MASKEGRTSFGSIRLSESEGEKKVSPATYLVAGLLVVAFAGFSTIHVTSATEVFTTDALEPFSAAKGSIANCDANAPGFLDGVPKYDPKYTPDMEAFYNACYYSYRCCTTQYSGCYVSESFGRKCQTCLMDNGPRMVRQTCDFYAHQLDVNGQPWSTEMIEKEQTVPTFTEEEIQLDSGFPKSENTDFKLKFCEVTMVRGELDSTCSGGGYPKTPDDKPDVQTCWVQAGPNDRRMGSFSDKCFEVISWCNLLCPRDAANSVQHNMCKHCTLFGFDQKKDIVAEQQEKEILSKGDRLEAQLREKAKVEADWKQEWTMP